MATIAPLPGYGPYSDERWTTVTQPLLQQYGLQFDNYYSDPFADLAPTGTSWDQYLLDLRRAQSPEVLGEGANQAFMDYTAPGGGADQWQQMEQLIKYGPLRPAGHTYTEAEKRAGLPLPAQWEAQSGGAWHTYTDPEAKAIADTIYGNQFRTDRPEPWYANQALLAALAIGAGAGASALAAPAAGASGAGAAGGSILAPAVAPGTAGFGVLAGVPVSTAELAGTTGLTTLGGLGAAAGAGGAIASPLPVAGLEGFQGAALGGLEAGVPAVGTAPLAATPGTALPAGTFAADAGFTLGQVGGGLGAVGTGGGALGSLGAAGTQAPMAASSPLSLGTSAPGAGGATFSPSTGFFDTLSLGDLTKLVGPATSLLGGALGSNAATSAAETQAAAGQRALDLQAAIYADQQARQAPYLQAGYEGLAGIRNAPNFDVSPYTFGGTTPLPWQSFAFNPQDYAFTPPTADTLPQDPGYQFRLREGQRALENSATAKGMTFSGPQAKALQQYGQEMGSQEYQNAYNRLLTQNQLRYERDLAGSNLNYGRAQAENQQTYERGLAGSQLNYGRAKDAYGLNLARLGSLSNMGMGAANTLANLGTNYGEQAGKLLTSMGNVQGAGQVGATNAWQGALGNVGNTVQQYLTLQQLGNLYAQAQQGRR